MIGDINDDLGFPENVYNQLEAIGQLDRRYDRGASAGDPYYRLQPYVDPTVPEGYFPDAPSHIEY